MEVLLTGQSQNQNILQVRQYFGLDPLTLVPLSPLWVAAYLSRAVFTSPLVGKGQGEGLQVNFSRENEGRAGRPPFPAGGRRPARQGVLYVFKSHNSYPSSMKDSFRALDGSARRGEMA
jgi:hypothetical protein